MPTLWMPRTMPHLSGFAAVRRHCRRTGAKLVSTRISLRRGKRNGEAKNAAFLRLVCYWQIGATGGRGGSEPAWYHRYITQDILRGGSCRSAPGNAAYDAPAEMLTNDVPPYAGKAVSSVLI